MKWGLLVDDAEGVTKVCLDDQTHQEIKSKSEEIDVESNFKLLVKR